MIPITPAPAVPVVLPDSASPALFGPGEAEGVAFAAELALAMGGGEPAKLPAAPGPSAARDDGIRVKITFPAPDTGGGLFEPTISGLDPAGPIGLAAAPVTTATERAAAPPATPMPEVQDIVPLPAAPPPVPAAAPTTAPTAAPRSAPDAAAPDAAVMSEPQLRSSVLVPSPPRAEGRDADAEATPAPGPGPASATVADRAAPPVEARPINADPPLASALHTPDHAPAGNDAAPSGVETKPETQQPGRSRAADQPPRRIADQTEAPTDHAEPLAAGDLAVTAPDARATDTRDPVSSDQPAPEPPPRAPEAIGLSVAATPAPRPVGEAPRLRGGSVAAGPTVGAAASTPTSDTAEPASAGAPAEAKPRERAEARPRPAEPVPAADPPKPEAVPAAEPAEPTGRTPERTDQPTPRAEAAPRALAQPGTAEALPQLQPVERATPLSAAPPPPRAAPAAPAQQIAPVLITLAAGAAGMPDRLTLTLDPQELGRIEVEVSREGERRVAIAVLAERPETLHLLMRDAAILDRALAQAGVGTEGRSLAFDLGGGSDGRQQRGNGSATPAASPSPQPEPARPRDPLSLLDIAI